MMGTPLDTSKAGMPPKSAEQIGETEAGAVRDDAGEEAAASEASHVTGCAPDDIQKININPHFMRAPWEGRQPATCWVPNDGTALKMINLANKTTGQEIVKQKKELEVLMEPLLRPASMLAQLLQSGPVRPATAKPPGRGKHMGPRASQNVMIWVQTVVQADKVLQRAAQALGTTCEALKGDILRADSSKGLWSLLRRALRKNPLLTLHYRAFLQLASVISMIWSRDTDRASTRINWEQLILTVADVTGMPREAVDSRRVESGRRRILA